MSPRRPTFLASLTCLATLGALAATTAPAHAEELYVKVTSLADGVVGHWYNPVDTRAGVSLADYGAVDDLTWSFLSPRDTTSGLPTGKKVYKPLTLRVRMSGATSTLATALDELDRLSEVRVVRFAPDPDSGGLVEASHIVLTNAIASTMNVYTVREATGLVTYVDIGFTYESIGIEDVASGVSFEGDVATAR